MYRVRREQLLCRQIARLAPVENRLGDVRGEIAEADNPSEIGSAHSLAQSKRSKGDAVALDQCRVEAARLRSSLINRASGFAAANGSVPSISILISIPALRSRAGTDRIRVSSSSMLCDGTATSKNAVSPVGRRWMST